MKTIPGPDFPTGGFIVGRAGHLQRLHDRPRLDHDARARRRSRRARRATSSSIVVTEIPYQVNKARLIEKIAELRAREDDRGHLRPARRVRPRRHAHRHRAEARRGARGRPQQPLQAHAAADDVRHHHAGDRRRPAAASCRCSTSSSTSSSSAAKSCGAGPSSSCARPRRGPTSSKASRSRSITSTR